MTKYHVNPNELDKALKELALHSAPKQIAKCGDIVMAQLGWKKPHQMKITMINLEIVPIDLTIGERQNLDLDGWMVTQWEYFGRKLKANGEMSGSSYSGYLITEFTSSDGQNYKRLHTGFNHVGLSFEIDTLVKSSIL